MNSSRTGVSRRVGASRNSQPGQRGTWTHRTHRTRTTVRTTGVPKNTPSLRADNRAYIPYLGAFLSGAVAVLVSFADGGLTTALWVLGVVTLVQFLEGNVFQPMIQSRTLQMHPAVILVALTAGASLAGILGMLLAVPLTAAAFGVLSEMRGRYEEGVSSPSR